MGDLILEQGWCVQQKLLSRGANVEERDEHGGFSLGWAAYSGNTRIAQDLLWAGK